MTSFKCAVPVQNRSSPYVSNRNTCLPACTSEVSFGFAIGGIALCVVAVLDVLIAGCEEDMHPANARTAVTAMNVFIRDDHRTLTARHACKLLRVLQTGKLLRLFRVFSRSRSTAV